MPRQIFAAEISHEDTPLHLRETLAASEQIVKQHLVNLRNSVNEVFILSTCNRFTVYVIHDDIAPLENFFAAYPALKGYIQFYYNSDESVTHLFAVAGGLLSPIKGDHEVLDQIRLAHQWAIETDSVGITLNNLVNEAIRIGTKARTESGIDKFCTSVVDAGIELLYKRLDGVHNKKFLIVGTGKVARQALKCLYNEGIKEVCIISKDLKRAEELADRYYARAASMNDIQEQVKYADVIIGCTHYDVTLFTSNFLADCSDLGKMWFVLDFGMPRNFNGKLNDHSSIELYNLDDLKRLYQSPLDAFGGIELAWTIVMREAKSFMEILMQLEFSPVLVAYWSRLRDLKKKTTKLLLPKLEQLSQADIEKIKNQKQQIVRSFSFDPWKNNLVLSNNSVARNPKEAARKIVFEKIKLNVTEN